MKPTALSDAQPLEVFLRGQGMVKVGRWSRTLRLYQWRGDVQARIVRSEEAIGIRKAVWLKLEAHAVERIELLDTRNPCLWVVPMARAIRDGRKANAVGGAVFLIPVASWDREHGTQEVEQPALFEVAGVNRPGNAVDL